MSEQQKQKVRETLKRNNKGKIRKRDTTINKICPVCDITFKTNLVQPRTYCTFQCCNSRPEREAIYRKTGLMAAARNLKRSKDEIALYNLCANHFPNVTHNVAIKDGWDADIILNDHKIAILWNGRWHREQLTFSNHSLLQVQTRDKIKHGVLSDAGWNVLIFEDNEFTPESAFQYIKMVVHGVGFEPTK